jgi:hypothetical protein
MTGTSLGTKHEINDDVVVNFGAAGVISGKVVSVIFKEGVVNYDILIIPFPESNEVLEPLVIKDVRGYYVEKPFARFKAPIYENGFNGESNVGWEQVKN